MRFQLQTARTVLNFHAKYGRIAHQTASANYPSTYTEALSCSEAPESQHVKYADSVLKCHTYVGNRWLHQIGKLVLLRGTQKLQAYTRYKSVPRLNQLPHQFMHDLERLKINNNLYFVLIGNIKFESMDNYHLNG
jgi:hypothetical protein